jgi:YD repeat-containing protein
MPTAASGLTFILKLSAFSLFLVLTLPGYAQGNVHPAPSRPDTPATAPVWPLPKKHFDCRLTDITETFHDYYSRKLIRHEHHLDYNDAGKPLTHHLTTYVKGKQTAQQTYHYTYDSTGKLASKVSADLQQLYYYDSAGALNKVAVSRLSKGEWTLTHVTQLTTTINPDKSQHIKLRRAIKKGRKIRLNQDIDFVPDTLGNIKQRQTNLYNFTFANFSPQEYEYDHHPNPVRNLALEPWPELDLVANSVNNIIKLSTAGQVIATTVYEYNQFGYPVKSTLTDLRRYKNPQTARQQDVTEFTYQIIELPVAVPDPGTRK